MDNFNFKKFLTENKLTKTSFLREGYDEFKREDKGSKDVTAKDKGEEEVYGAGVKKGEKIEKLKAKIKEMIIAELELDVDSEAADDKLVNFYEGEEDYEKAGREVEYGINPETGKEEFDLKDFFMDDEEETTPEIPGFEGTRDALDDLKIREAKKDEEEAPEEELSDEEIDTTIDTTATGEDFNVDTSAVDPNIKAVQDALTQAQAAAKNINDDKLTQQIGNTITMFTRTHIANTESPVNEEMPMGPEEYIVAVEDSNTNTTEIMFTGPKNKALTAYNNIGARYWDNPEARVFIMSKSAFEQNN